MSEKYLDYDFIEKGNEKNSEMEFSLLSGYNFYKTSHTEEEKTYLGIHVQTNTPVRIMQIGITSTPINRKSVQWHQRFIQKVMSQECFEWPIDMIEYQNSEQKYVQCYVFPLKAYPEFISIKNLLYQEKTSKKLDWRNDEIRDIIRNLLKVFSNLHENGFSYNDFDMNRIFFEPKSRKIFLRYNTNILMVLGGDEKSYIDVQEIAMEFAPSYIYESEKFVGNMDNYSISSLLFRLMIGRMPYEGKGLTSFGEVFDPIRDTDKHVHEYYFEHYHQYPVFIFAQDDDSNSLGPMSENNLPKERWNALPPPIREMFQNSLGYMQKEQREKWYYILHKNGWKN